MLCEMSHLKNGNSEKVQNGNLKTEKYNTLNENFTG